MSGANTTAPVFVLITKIPLCYDDTKIIVYLKQLRSMPDVAMDSTLTSHKLIYFGKGEEPPRDSVSNLIRQFYENQFHHFSDPLAPYFLFLSKDSK